MLEITERVRPASPDSTSLNTPARPTAAVVSSPLIVRSAIGATTTGASFCALMVIETVAGADWTWPSETTNVKLSAPETFACGMYVSDAPAPVSAPSDGGVTIDEGQDIAVRVAAPSVSAADTSSFVETDCPNAWGGSFTGLTVIETVAVELMMPSSALKVKLSGPK